MRVKIYPSKAIGKVETNISKSYAHRALIAASLSDGTSEIYFSKKNLDIIATINALRQLGANIEELDDRVIVKGCNPANTIADEVFCNESGSTLRFLIPIFGLSNKEISFTGKGRLMDRPQKVYQDFFNENGLEFKHNLKENIIINGPIKSGHYKLDGSISSQFFTGLLFALPLVDGDSVISISEPFESKSYVLMTLEVLNQFGIKAQLIDNDLYIKGNQKYISTNYKVEGDYSSAAFFALLGAINAKVEMTNLNLNSTQGDKQFIEFVRNAGAKVIEKDDTIIVQPDKLNRIVADLADCPDLGPAAMVLGCFSENGIKLDNIARLRYKESDRVLAMQTELEKFGFEMDAKENELTINGVRKEIEQKVIEIDSHNDHRIAMAMAILACSLNNQAIINGAESVNKSYPDFFKDLASCNVKLEVLDD